MPSHHAPEDLNDGYKNIKYMPLNVTSVEQPTLQNFIERTKKKYRYKFLRKIFSKDDSDEN